MESGIAAIHKSPNTVFTSQDLAAVWTIPNKAYLKSRIEYYIKRGYLRRVCYGIYAKDNVPADLMEVGNRLRTPSYVSFETVLFREGMIFQKYTAVFLASYCTVTVRNEAGEFVYRCLKDDILFCKDGVIVSGTYSVATKERAFLDLVYVRKEFHCDNLRPLDWGKVDALVPLYGSKALKRRVEEYRKNARSE